MCHPSFRFSAVIPCHNGARWIESALKSVIAQTFPVHEIIVVDDSSTDDLNDVIANCGIPVRLLHTRARNAAASRNLAIKESTGNWIALLDVDDIWYPNHLERAVELLSRATDVAFMSNHDWISVDGSVRKIPAAHQCKLQESMVGLPPKMFFELVGRGFHFGHSTVIYRRERVIEVGLFNSSQIRRHDIDLWLRVIAERTWTYDTVVSAGYCVDTPGSISKNEVECDYFYLRALWLNSSQFECSCFEVHLREHARRAMGIALSHGSDEHYRRIRELAFNYLPPVLQLLYLAAEKCPAIAVAALQGKRWVARAIRHSTKINSA